MQHTLLNRRKNNRGNNWSLHFTPGSGGGQPAAEGDFVFLDVNVSFSLGKTLSLWWNPINLSHGTSDRPRAFIGNRKGVCYSYMKFTSNRESGSISMETNRNGDNITVAGEEGEVLFNVGEWQHITLVWNPTEYWKGTFELYVNGIHKATSNENSNNEDASELLIGTIGVGYCGAN